MNAKKIVALFFSIAFFCLTAAYGLPAQAGAAASSQWCHDQAIALQKTCAKASMPIICAGSLSSFMSSCDKAFPHKATDLQKMTAAKLKLTLDAEAAKFSTKVPNNGALINPATATPYVCSKEYVTTNCLTPIDCEKNFIDEFIGAAKVPEIKGIWDAKTKKCNLPTGTCFVDAQCLSTQYCGDVSDKIIDVIHKILPKDQWGTLMAVDKTAAANVYKCYNKKFGNLACNDLFPEQCLSKECTTSGISPYDNPPSGTVCSCKKIEHCPVGNVCYAPVGAAGYCKEPKCGDGKTDLPFEECDANTGDEGGACTPLCKKAKCGDKYVQKAPYLGAPDHELLPGQQDYGEQCDDGNKINTDSCTNFCENAKCGDSYIQPSEQCDDKNTDAGDGCSPTCQIECGNGAVDAPLEDCDDKNLINTDTCTNECRFPKCGDGFWQISNGEQCDDGNNINTGDGCDNECKLEGVEPEKETKNKTTVVLKTGFGEVDGEYCCNGSLYCLPPITEKKNKEAYVGKVLQCLNQNWCEKGACNTLLQCGNGKKDTNLEECDDGNDVNNDGCSTTCKNEVLKPVTVSANGKTLYCTGTPLPCIAKVKLSEAGYAENETACLKQYKCTDSICVNGKKDGSEQCDDGNENNADDCTNECKEPTCGDGIQKKSGAGVNTTGVELKPGEDAIEACDDGNKVDEDACTNKCAVAACGDWIVRKDKGHEEECDDGNKVSGDGCSDLCKNEKAPPNCGDNKTKTKEGEECDDGNKASGDGCSAICKLEKGPDTCGNKVLDPPAEECDASDPANTIPCSKICKKLGTCGNGMKEVGEECDDKNTTDGDGCSAKCQIEVTPKGCGNGKKAKSEACDDNNNLNGDGCSYDCKKEAIPPHCGTDKGVVQAAEGEECDDGNTKNGDGCSLTCKLENKAGGPGGAPAALKCDPVCAKDQECKANPDPKATKKTICVGICSPACEAWQTCAPTDPAKPETVACAFLKDKCNVEADCKDATKTCDAVNHNCIVKKNCKSHAECNPDPLPTQFCDVDKLLCFPLLMAGNSCKSDKGESQNDYCASGVCSDKPDSKCGCKIKEDCAQNQLCDISTKVCKDKLAVGAACNVAKPEECISGNCKDSVCLCNKSSECPDGKYCGAAKGNCLEKVGENGVCEDKEQCLSGECVIKPGEKTGTCTKPTAPVAPAGGTGGPAPKQPDILLVNPLNEADPSAIIGRVIAYVIGLTGSLALIMFMYGGALWIFSGGNDKNIQKGKDTLIWAAIGMAFVFTSYIIVKFVMKMLGANI